MYSFVHMQNLSLGCEKKSSEAYTFWPEQSEILIYFQCYMHAYASSDLQMEVKFSDPLTDDGSLCSCFNCNRDRCPNKQFHGRFTFKEVFNIEYYGQVLNEANLTNAVLSRTVLTRSDLGGATIEGADFSDAVIDLPQKLVHICFGSSIFRIILSCRFMTLNNICKFHDSVISSLAHQFFQTHLSFRSCFQVLQSFMLYKFLLLDWCVQLVRASP